MTHRNSIGTVIAALGSFVAIGGVVDARSPSAPPISSATINGTWEAVAPELPRLYVLNVGDVKAGMVRLAVLTGAGVPTAVVFATTKVEIEKGGRFVMQGEGEGADRGFSVEVNLVGTAFGENGSMTGTVTIRKTPDTGPPSQRQVLFVRRTEGLVDWLFRTRARAEELLHARK